MNFQKEQFEQYVNGKKWDLLAVLLNETFKLNVQSEEPEPLNVSKDCIETLGNILIELKAVIDDNSNYRALEEVLKALRNCVVFNPIAQDLVIENPQLLDNLKVVMNIMLDSKPQAHAESCLKIALQFLINLVVTNQKSGIIVWQEFQEIINRSLQKSPLFYNSVALIYNIFLNNLNLIKENSDLFEAIIELSLICTNEYVIFLAEICINQDNFPHTYLNLKKNSKRFVLEFLKEKLLKKDIEISPKFLQLLTEEFKKKSDCILKTVDEYVKQIEPLEVKLLADNIASLSSDEKYLKQLQKDKSLLINTAYLLKCIHNWGKQSENEFSAIQKLSELTPISHELETHPVFGFKASLIRLLGNLCWKHLENQNLVNELECIPVLLDSCNIDAKNPFIIQWTIFAIRNICEGNRQNQNVISSMNMLGTVDSTILQEMGLTLHSEGENQIGIIPLDQMKKL